MWRWLLLVLFGALASIGFGQEGYANGLPKDSSYFPIAVWLQAPSNAARYKAIGVNLYVGLYKGPTSQQIAELKRAGMPVICDQNEWALNHLDEKTIVGWMHGDEPDNAQSLTGYWQNDTTRITKAWPEYAGRKWSGYGPPIPPSLILQSYRRIAKADPTRPVILNLGQGVAWEGWGGRGVRTGKLEDYPLYVRGCDIASFDIYPVVHSNAAVRGRLEFVPKGVGRLLDWTENRKPVWSCIETTRINAGDRKASPTQIRSEVWMAIIRGATGLIYFAHEFKPRFQEAALLNDATTANAVKNINQQINNLAPVINSPTLPGAVKTTSAEVMAKRHGGDLYLFAADMSGEGSTSTFQLSSPESGVVEVIGENRLISLNDGKFVDAFAGYGVHLYRVRAS
jgi:hypothetical protein